MSSITIESNGRRKIQFQLGDGKRRSYRLGKVTQREAESIQTHIDELVNSQLLSRSTRLETVAWVNRLSDPMHKRLSACGLTKPRAVDQQTNLGPFIDRYIEGRADIKPRTKINCDQAKKALIAFFGTDRSMTSITPGDADAFRQFLLKRGLAENTARRICGRARQYFRAAIRLELMTRNPFDGIKCAVGANLANRRFVTRADAQKVLDACPDNSWRLIFALSRFGGLRCPSEHLALKWEDIDWANDRMTIHSPKTEHHEGKAFRVMPIFPELRPYLLMAFEGAKPGTNFVIERTRDNGVNWRTQMQRIIKRAGLQPWPKLFHNLRASRETELTESFPLHVVCAWIGNSPSIAAKHYLSVTEAHFEKAVQIPVQQIHETAGKPSQAVETRKSESAKNPEKCSDLRADAGNCENLQMAAMPPAGLEPATR